MYGDSQACDRDEALIVVGASGELTSTANRTLLLQPPTFAWHFVCASKHVRSMLMEVASEEEKPWQEGNPPAK